MTEGREIDGWVWAALPGAGAGRLDSRRQPTETGHRPVAGVPFGCNLGFVRVAPV